MKTKAIFGSGIIWAMLVCIGLSVSKPIHEMIAQGGSDKVAVDERPSRYPALDLEDLCKQSQNPKCEALVDDFCRKSCTVSLCSEYGPIRGMCRLMCEAEDLLPECSKMGPSGAQNSMSQQNPQMYPYQNQQVYPYGMVPFQ